VVLVEIRRQLASIRERRPNEGKAGDVTLSDDDGAFAEIDEIADEDGECSDARRLLGACSSRGVHPTIVAIESSDQANFAYMRLWTDVDAVDSDGFHIRDYNDCRVI